MLWVISDHCIAVVAKRSHASSVSLVQFEIKVLLTELRNVTDVEADDETPDWFIKSVA